jgi:hypothetical protein
MEVLQSLIEPCDRSPEGGIEERGFGTINTDFLAGLYGYDEV